MVLRRFEIYSLRPAAAVDKVRQLEEAFRRCGEFVPVVKHSVVGRNLSDVPVDLVWEHSFDSPEDYRRYMVHHYHASILDRFLLADSPERIVTDGVLGDGALVGYRCAEPSYYMRNGVRKVVLFGLEGSQDELSRFRSALEGLPGAEPGVVVSVVEPNTLGSAWFDGVTPVGAPSQWSHVWELGFDSLDAYDAYQRGSSVLARAERNGWKDRSSTPVRRAVELHYVVGG